MEYNSLEEKTKSLLKLKNWAQIDFRYFQVRSMFTFLSPVWALFHIFIMLLSSSKYTSKSAGKCQYTQKFFIILLFSHFSSFPFFCCHHYLPSKRLDWQFIIISVYLFKLTGVQIALNKGSVHVIDVCTANCLCLCARQVAERSITSKIPFFRMNNLPSALLSIRKALHMVQKCC